MNPKAHSGQRWPGGHPWSATQQVGELLYLRERYLSHRLLDGYDVIVDACRQAGNQLTSECIRSLCNYPFSEAPQPLAAPLLPW